MWFIGIDLNVHFSCIVVLDLEKIFRRATEAVVANFKDPKIAYMVEALRKTSAEVPQPVILRGVDLDFDTDLSNVKLLDERAQNSDADSLSCSHFCLESKKGSPVYSAEVRKSVRD